MRRYRFRLEPVLRVRRSEQDAARGALLAATAELAAHEREAQARAEAYAARAQRPVPTEVGRFRVEQAHRQALVQALLEQRQRVEDARLRQAETRDAWSAAAARVGALERLDERQREAHRLDELKEQDALTDELVVARHGRVPR